MKTNRADKGFTLLEVIVSLAITGFVLGSLFTLVAGSKQLSWRSEESLVEATRLRAVTNFALLQNEYNDVEPIIEDDTFDIRPLEILEEPERKTQPSTFTLQDFEIINLDNDDVIIGSRWIELALPQ